MKSAELYSGTPELRRAGNLERLSGIKVGARSLPVQQEDTALPRLTFEQEESKSI